MINKLNLLFICVLMGCAEPKYAPAASEPAREQDATDITCVAKFSDSACVTLAWEKIQTEDDFGSFIFKTYDSELFLSDFLNPITVVLWMPSMGHGSTPVKVEKLEPGTYRASQVFFTMKGDWEIRFQRKEGHAVKDQAIFSFRY